jgi:hypothetical protein
LKGRSRKPKDTHKAATSTEEIIIEAGDFIPEPPEKVQEFTDDADQPLLLDQPEQSISASAESTSEAEPESAPQPQRAQDKQSEPAKSFNTAVAKSDMCVNHPWRHAYARCAYCFRPFCYADLVDYDKQQYCLEDINNIKSPVAAQGTRMSRLVYIVSILFALNSIILLYYTYPQILLLANNFTSIKAAEAFFTAISYNYFIIVASAAFIILGFIASLLVISNSRRRYYTSAFILMLMIFFFSYQYLTSSTSSSNYLIYILVELMANVVVLTFCRLQYVGVTSSQTFSQEVEWPRVGHF